MGGVDKLNYLSHTLLHITVTSLNGLAISLSAGEDLWCGRMQQNQPSCLVPVQLQMEPRPGQCSTCTEEQGDRAGAGVMQGVSLLHPLPGFLLLSYTTAGRCAEHKDQVQAYGRVFDRVPSMGLPFNFLLFVGRLALLAVSVILLLVAGSSHILLPYPEMMLHQGCCGPSFSQGDHKARVDPQ